MRTLSHFEGCVRRLHPRRLGVFGSSGLEDLGGLGVEAYVSLSALYA